MNFEVKNLFFFFSLWHILQLSSLSITVSVTAVQLGNRFAFRFTNGDRSTMQNAHIWN
jgi:hypothetical protein